METITLLISKFFKRQEFLFLFCMGLLLICGINFLMVQKYHREQAYHQSLMAQQLQAQIQSLLEEHVTALISLNVVYQNFVDINHYDFQQYGQSITVNLKGFHRLFFIDPSLTIRRVYPFSLENTLLLNKSLKADPRYSTLFNRAKNNRSPITSGLVTFLGHSRVLLALIPIYRNNQQFLGYAAGEIALEKIWDPLSHIQFLENYQVQLIDPGGHAFFAGFYPQKNKLLTQVPFHITNQRWVLLLQPSHGSNRILVQSAEIWVSGLTILTLLLLLRAGSKRYRENFQEAQKQFETIFNASPDGIVLLDEKLQLQLSNPKIQSWSGLSQAKLNTKHFFDLFTCQCPHLKKCQELSFLLCTSDHFQKDLPETLEAVMTSPALDEGTRTLRLNASYLTHKGSHEIGKRFICVLGDISTRKELERVKETYIATLTHDLKTPLLAQEMVLETILDDKTHIVSQEHQKLLTGARASVKDLLEMVDATLLFYKLESSHLELYKQHLTITPLMVEVMETLKPLVSKREIHFELEKPIELPTVLIDPIQIKRVFHNLLSNAMHYARRNSVIHVRVSTQSSEAVLIEICNDGKGILPSEIPRIFDKYYSLSRKFKQIGTGLGLYICRRIVELHGGKIWAESEPEKETRFFILLPSLQTV